MMVKTISYCTTTVVINNLDNVITILVSRSMVLTGYNRSGTRPFNFSIKCTVYKCGGRSLAV
jgi:hypothetical protein